MPVYISMLRGINIGPHKRMKMEKLRASCEALGLEQVKTYIQSGNLILKAATLSSSALSRRIEKQIASDFGFSVNVISRSREEMNHIIRNNPLLKEASIDATKLYVTFLSDTPTPAALKKLQTLTLEPDRAHCLGQEIYLYFPHGVSGSSLWKHPLDRVLSVITTTRNWNTVNKLSEMALECK